MEDNSFLEASESETPEEPLSAFLVPLALRSVVAMIGLGLVAFAVLRLLALQEALEHSHRVLALPRVQGQVTSESVVPWPMGGDLVVLNIRYTFNGSDHNFTVRQMMPGPLLDNDPVRQGQVVAALRDSLGVEANGEVVVTIDERSGQRKASAGLPNVFQLRVQGVGMVFLVLAGGALLVLSFRNQRGNR